MKRKEEIIRRAVEVFEQKGSLVPPLKTLLKR
jgi:hypothetical protein